MKRSLAYINLIAILVLTAAMPQGPAAAQQTGTVIVNLADADLTFVGESAGDWAGYSVAPAGDVNNDGYDDLVIGAPYFGPDADKGDGKGYLVLGRPRDQWPADHVGLAQADASFTGPDSVPYRSDMLARQVYTAGDVNGDGYDDFLVSHWMYSMPEARGRAYLFLGRAQVDWGQAFPVEEADASFVGESQYDYASWYVSTVGDVNGDGLDDFAITATGNEEGGGYQAGQVYLFLGRAAADWGHDFDLAQADATFLGEAEGDRAGRSATGVGDVNADGYADFMIGAIGSDYSAEDAGQAYLLLGRPAADWGRDMPLSMADASFVGEAAGDQLGRRVAWAGDANGDGYDDFLLGASYNDQVALEAGKAYLFLGRPAADWGLHYPAVQADASFLGEVEWDEAGRRVSGAGDINDDGYDDFLICAPHSDRAADLAGATYFFYGRPDAGWGHDVPLAEADIIYEGEAANDRAGYDLARAGDFDGDGVEDMILGAYRSDEPGGSGGVAYVLFGATSGLPQPVAFAPDAPQGKVGEWHTFTGTYSDPNGWSDLASARLLLGASTADLKAFNVLYEPAANALYLRNWTDTAWLGPCTPGARAKLTNNIVQLDCSQSSASGDGDILQVAWRGRWIQKINRPRPLTAHLRAADQAGHDSGFVPMGSWTLNP